MRRILHTLAVLLAALAAGLYVPAAAVAQGTVETKPAASPTISMKVELIWEEPPCVGEPVILRVTFTNLTDKGQMVSLGNTSWNTLYFGVYDHDGKLVGVPPPGKFPFRDFFSMGMRLGPGKQEDRYEILDKWCRIEKPGAYEVRAQLTTPSSSLAGGTPISECRFTFTVVPLDEARLALRCRQLYRKEMPSDDYRLKDLAVPALLTVRHDVALPYFDNLAAKDDPRVCYAIRRVGTVRAVRLLRELSARTGMIGRAAKAALENPPVEKRNADGTLDLNVWYEEKR